MSESQSNSRTTSDMPARLMLSSAASPGTVDRDSSMGRLTWLSTSPGAAPGYSVRTVSVG